MTTAVSDNTSETTTVAPESGTDDVTAPKEEKGVLLWGGIAAIVALLTTAGIGTGVVLKKGRKL